MFSWFKELIQKIFCADHSGHSEPINQEPVGRRVSDLSELKVGAIGVDISHHNDEVDLKELATNVEYIYMKATEGRTFVSPAYESRAKILKGLDVLWGAYHYYRIDTDPIEQAKNFVRFKSGWTLPPVLDIEQYGNERYNHAKHTPDLLVFLKYVEEHTGFVPVIYTSYYYARDVIRPTVEFAKYPLWLAWYTKDFERVLTPLPWSEIKIWQKTESGRIKGVEGNVDINEVVS